MELSRVFWDLAVPVMAALLGYVWRSAYQRVELLQSRVERLEDRQGRVEVKLARLDGNLESSRR